VSFRQSGRIDPAKQAAEVGVPDLAASISKGAEIGGLSKEGHMKFGIGLGHFQEPEDLVDIVRKADELGYESAWMSDHVVFPKEILSTYPYAPDGKPPYVDWRCLDPFVTFGRLASATKNIRFGTFVYILPLRNVFITARAITTVDVLSGGRMMLGCGVGWLGEEFDLIEQDFHNRGKRANEIVQILKLLFTQDTPEFHGKYYSFGPVKFEPKPLQKPFLPIHFGGDTEPAMRRAARYGDGWMSGGNFDTPEGATEKIHKVNGMRRQFGREDEPFEFTILSPGSVDSEQVERYRTAGADRLLVAPLFGDITADAGRVGAARAALEAMSQLAPRTVKATVIGGLERFAEQVMSRLPE
jgi:probable F420-dependent oxidoreductase